MLSFIFKQEYVGEMDATELRQYMRALMVALRHVHSFGVIHRDVKPSNFLYDRDNKRYAINITLPLYTTHFLHYNIIFIVCLYYYYYIKYGLKLFC